VLSAIIVARGGAQGVGGSAKERLIGTLIGAAAGLVASQLVRLGLPQWVLLFVAMAPLGFLSADKAAFRAAPVAAMIVLSAASSGKGEYAGAGVALSGRRDPDPASGQSAGFGGAIGRCGLA
jgi:uncharacterized membrane protein YccC